MSSVLARYDVSGERRKPKPSGRTSSTPPPKIDSPFFACCFRSAKMRSCLRIRLAPSISFALATSISSETCFDFSSDKGIGGEDVLQSARGGTNEQPTKRPNDDDLDGFGIARR